MLAIAQPRRRAGCWESLFTLGEQPEARYPQAAEWLAANGYESTVDYLVAAAQLVLDETGLLPHANAGALSQPELERLRKVSPSQGMMIETLAARLGEPGGPHHGAPDKTPERRLATLEAAGRARVPFTTGILVGIGETRAERIDALEAIAESHRRHGHVQEVIVQNFLPKLGTSMHRAPACPPEELLWSIAVARLDPPCRRAPAGAAEPQRRSGAVARRGNRRLGRGFAGHRRPREPRAAVACARAAPSRYRGGRAHARAPPHDLSRVRPRPRHVARSRAAHAGDGRVRLRRARTRRRVVAGSRRPRAAAAALGGHARARGCAVDEVLAACVGRRGGRRRRDRHLLGARGPEVAQVAAVADELRREIVGGEITFVRNRNINYTNVCTFKCRFCAFSKGPLSLNLRGQPYLLEMEEMQRRVLEAVECGATEVCLQGGIHPDFDGDYYVDVARAVKAVAPQIHVHGFTALEVTEGATRLDMPLADYLAS